MKIPQAKPKGIKNPPMAVIPILKENHRPKMNITNVHVLELKDA